MNAAILSIPLVTSKLNPSLKSITTSNIVTDYRVMFVSAQIQ